MRLKWQAPRVEAPPLVAILDISGSMSDYSRIMLHFLTILGNHAGSGLIAAALLILYVFNRVIGSARFWKAALGDAFAPGIPGICKSYLELLACYLLFIGALGLSITLARRLDPR